MSVISDLFGGGSKAKEMASSLPPQVNAEPPAPDKEKLKRAGRAALLINTSSEGVLGKAKTGRSSLLSAT